MSKTHSKRRRSPGEGSVVEYRGKRGVTYRGKFTDETGKPVMVTLAATTKKEAVAELAEIVAEVRKLRKAGKRRIGVAPTFSQYAPGWLDRTEAHRALAPLSVTTYKASLNRLSVYFADKPLNEIGRVEVSHFVSAALEEGYAASTVSYDVSRLSDVLSAAANDDLIASVPKFEHPRVQKSKWRILRPAEIGPVHRAFEDAKAALMFLVFVVTGMRRKEVLHLRWEHVHLADPEGPYLHVTRETTKSDSGVRDIDLPPFLSDALFQHRAESPYRSDDDLVFCTSKGTTIHPDWFVARFKTALKKTGITDHVRLHDLRHSAITNRALDAKNSAQLQQTAGHASLSTTEGYIALAGVRFPEEAAALEKRYGFSLATPKPETATPVAVEDEASSRNLK